MRIIEPTDNAFIDYLAAKDRGVSSTIRPFAGLNIEALVANYTGPPSLIFWSRDFDDNMLRGWAVPYTTLDKRRAASAGVLGLQNPGLTYMSFPQGIGSTRAWLRGGRVIGPDYNNPRLVFQQPVETILATPKYLTNIIRDDAPIPTLLNIVVFIGCEFFTMAQVNSLKDAFPGVNIVICYYRSWTGIISVLNASGMTADNQAGLPITGVSVQIGARFSQIQVSGESVAGIRMLTAGTGEIDYSGQWVPTRNRGSIEAGGGIIVSGYVT